MTHVANSGNQALCEPKSSCPTSQCCAGTKNTLKPGNQKPGATLKHNTTSQQSNRGPELASSKEAVLEPQYAGLSAAVANGPLINSLLVGVTLTDLGSSPFCMQTLMPCSVLQSTGQQGTRSVESILEDVISTNKSAPDARAATASRLHNKVLLLDNPTATLTTKPTRRKHIRYSSQIASPKNRPAFGKNSQKACLYLCKLFQL